MEPADLSAPEPTEVPDRQPVSGARRGPGARLVVLYGAAVLFLLGLFGLAKPRGLLETTLQELQDILLLGFGGLVLLELTALVGRRWIRKRSLYYAVAVVTVLALAFGVPLVLDGFPRVAGSAVDGFIGAFGFLAVSAAFDRGLKREHSWLRGWPRRAIGGLGVVLVISVLHPLAPVLTSYAGRSGAFPVVVDLASSWQEPFIEVDGAELFVGKGPEDWSRRAGRRVALLLFDGQPGGGVTVHEPFKDWTGFSVLRLNVYSTGTKPVRVYLRLEDRTREQPAAERVDYALRVVPGENDFIIPLQAFAATPSGRNLNMGSIRRVGLHLGEPAEPMLRLYLHRIRIAEQ
jgi:hypothetical protein